MLSFRGGINLKEYGSQAALFEPDALSLLRRLVTKYGAVPWYYQETSGAVADAENSALTVPDTRDLIINGDFANWTADDPDGWTVVGEVGADPEVSEVGSGESHGGSGTGSCNLFSSATSVNPQIRQNILAVGKTFEITTVISAITGTLKVKDLSAGIDQNYTTTGTKILTGTAANATLAYQANTPAADITIDSVIVKQTNIPANDPNMDATHTGTTVGQPGPAGLLAVSYDGTNDYTDAYSPELNSMFDPTKGTMMFAAKVNAGVWADGLFRRLGRMYVDANNFVDFVKLNTPNTINVIYKAGGTQLTRSVTVTTYDYFLILCTWDTTAAGGSGEFKVYLGDTQVGATQNGLGVWVGNFSTTDTVIGASNTAAANPWSGFITVPVLFRDVLAQTEITQIKKSLGVA